MIKVVMVKGKVKAYTLQHHKRQLQLQRCCTSQTERAYSLLRPRPRDFDLQPNSHTQPWSAV